MTPKERSTDLINKFGGSAEKVVNEIIALQVWTNPNTTENLAYWKEVLAAVKVNKAPIARAGLDQKIFLPINTAKLDGSASSDPDGSIIDLQYFWRKVIGPSLILIDATKAIATANNLVAGEYLFELKVVDKFNAFTFDFVTIRVIGTTTVIQSPTANAGLNASITLPVNTVTLSGSGSDPDGSIVGYQWTKISGPAQFAISSPNTAQTLVSNLVVGTYTFQLRVTDNKGATATDTVVITVNDVVVIPPGENFFASPTGTGTGTQASPFKIGDFLKIAKPGMT